MHRNRTILFSSLVITAALAAPGCSGDTEDTADEDVQVAEQASTGTDASTDLVYVSSLFRSDIASTMVAIEADVQVPACVAFDTDGLTFVEVSFDECLLADGHLLVDGAIRADVSATLSAITFAATTTDLRVGPAVITGAWDITDPFADGAPSTWSGATTIVGDGGRSVALTSSASWTVDGTCVTASFDGAIDRAIGTSTVEVDGVSRCAGECPTAGSVAVTYALGAQLSWTYLGDGTATVTTAGGRTFDIVLPCNF